MSLTWPAWPRGPARTGPASARRTARRAPRGAACRGSLVGRRGPPASASRSRPAPAPRRRVVGQGGELHLGRAARRRRPPPASASRSAASAWSSMARTWSRVPPRSPRRRAASPHPADPLGQLVQAAAAVDAAPQQVAQRLAQAAAGQHLAPDLVEGGPHVVRRRQRVGAAVPGAVAEPAVDGAAVGSASMRRTRSGRATVSLSMRRVRCSPSRTNSTAAAASPGRGVVAVAEPVEHLGQPRHRCRPGEQLGGRHQLAGLDDGALGEQVGEAGQVEPGQPGAEGLGDGDPQQVLEHLALAALLAHLELDLAEQGRHDRGHVADPGHGLAALADRADRRSAERGDALGAPRWRTGPRRRSAGPPRRLAQPAGEAGRPPRAGARAPSATSVGLLRDQRDLVGRARTGSGCGSRRRTGP